MRTEVMKKIKERGYWEIVLRPRADRPDGKNATFGELVRLIEDSQVQRRGMPYPFLKKTRFSDYKIVDARLESSMHYVFYLSTFRFHRGGLFVHHLGMPEDRWDDAPPPFVPWDYARQNPRPDPPFLDFRSTIHQLTEIFLFASRLASRGVFGDRVGILIRLHGTSGRILKFDGPLPALERHNCRTDPIEVVRAVKTPYELWLERDELAVDACIGIFDLFNFPSACIRGVLVSAQESP